MPELAEVEFMSRKLHTWLSGGGLTVDVLDPKLDADGSVSTLSIPRVRRVIRRAKYAIIEGNLDSLVVHFRMTGTVKRAGEELPKFTRAVFNGSKERVAFCDSRRFGTLEVVSTDSLEGWLRSKALGEEPWPIPRSGEWWWERLGAVRKPVKAALLDQTRVCGLGNILASEVLFKARVSPQRRACDVTVEEWDAVSKALHQTVQMVLNSSTGDEIQYVNQGGSAKESGFLVYGQMGQSAPCCGAPIVRTKDQGRSTFWCEKCQV